MKKYFIGFGSVLFVVSAYWGLRNNRIDDTNIEALIVQNVEAISQGEDGGCPNGCKANGSGCWCYFWYEYYREGNL